MLTKPGGYFEVFLIICTKKKFGEPTKLAVSGDQTYELWIESYT